MKRLSLGKIAALVICYFTLAAGVVVNKTVFERLPHLEDEFAYLYQAKIFAGGHTYVVRNEPVKVFWQPFVIQPETSPDGIQKRFGKYTPGWPLLLAIAVLFNAPWLMGPVLGTLNVAIVYRLGREIFDEGVGLTSALLLAISPMALLLNATLMSHVPAMFLGEVFVYAYWRLTRHGKGRYRWAILGGLALGLMISTRPLSAAAIGVPVILHALSRLLDVLNKDFPRRVLAMLRPLLVLSLFVIPTAGLWPLFNHIWTGDWRTNTYTLLWSYDRPGFGPGYGLNPGGHSIEYGWRNARADMEWYLRDLFGFTMRDDIAKYLKDNLGWGAGNGISWILVIAGLFAGRKREWLWLFAELFVAVFIAQLTYWIGSVVHGGAAYSLRYWYEGTFGVCLVAGYGAVALVRAVRPAYKAPLTGRAVRISYLNGIQGNESVPVNTSTRNTAQGLRRLWYTLWPGYLILLAICVMSLLGYTPARFRESMPPDWPNGLYGYNKIGQHQLDALNAMRARYGQPGQPVLIVVLRRQGQEDNWRDYGAAMAVSSPYLDSDIIVARVFEPEDAPEVIQRFPGRLVLYQVGEDLYKAIDDAMNGAAQESS